MAIAFVTETSVQNTAAASHAVSLTSTGGTCLVALIAVRTGTTQNVSGVTDSAGNTWTAGPGGAVSGSNTRIEIWYALNAAAVTSVTIDLTASLAATINIVEFSGVATVSALDQSATASNASTATPTSGSVTTTNANDVLVAAISSTSAASLSGYSAGWTGLTGYAGVGTTRQGLRDAYRIESATGTFECVFTMGASSNWGGAMLALQAAPSGSITASVAITDAADAVASAGAISIAGTASLTDAVDTIQSTGTLAGVGTGALAVTDADDTLTASGALTLVGMLTVAEGGDLVLSTSVLTVAGAAALTEANDMLAATGTASISLVRRRLGTVRVAGASRSSVIPGDRLAVVPGNRLAVVEE